MDSLNNDLHELEKLYKEASAAYATGEPIMSDRDFDALEVELRDLGSELVNFVSEDFENEEEELVANHETFSIYSPKTWVQVEAFFKAYPNASFVAALKFDGICTKLSIDSERMVGQSRNRGARTAIDYTDAVNIAIPKPLVRKPVNITGESFVEWDDLPYLRAKYNPNKYVMPRSAALSLLRTPNEHDEEDVKKLQFRAFATDMTLANYESELLWLKTKGFQIPVYEVFRIDTTEDIKTQLMPIFSRIDTGEPSDGVVIQVNERDIVPTIEGKYMSTQIAFKLEQWGGHAYEAEVIGLNIGKAKGNKGTTLQIKPMTLEDNSTINKVNAYNLGIVERLKIKKGSIIRFERVSNNMCNLIYK